MADDALKLWLGKEETRGFIGELFGRITTRQEGYQKEALAQGDTDYAKGQADALHWASQIPETIMNTINEDTGVDP